MTIIRLKNYYKTKPLARDGIEKLRLGGYTVDDHIHQGEFRFVVNYCYDAIDEEFKAINKKRIVEKSKKR